MSNNQLSNTENKEVLNLINQLNHQDLKLFINSNKEIQSKLIDDLLLIGLNKSCKIKSEFDNKKDYRNQLVTDLENKIKFKKNSIIKNY